MDAGASTIPIPLAILAGRDRAPRTLPGDVGGGQALTGYKAIDVRVDTRTLLELCAERMQACGAFAPILIVGPRAIVAHANLDLPVIDVDGSFGHNVAAAIAAMRREAPRGSLAIITCDVLPEAAELEALLRQYRGRADRALWFPLVRRPDDASALGASAWKPHYRLRAPSGAEVPVLPGHICIFDPEKIRLRFMLRLVDLGYRTRNQPLPVRLRYMMPRLTLALLREDIEDLLALHPPLLTITALRAAFRFVRMLHEGRLAHADMESFLGLGFTDARYRGQPFAIEMPIMETLSLAKDIDTHEEAHALTEGARA